MPVIQTLFLSFPLFIYHQKKKKKNMWFESSFPSFIYNKDKNKKLLSILSTQLIAVIWIFSLFILVLFSKVSHFFLLYFYTLSTNQPKTNLSPIKIVVFRYLLPLLLKKKKKTIIVLSSRTLVGPTLAMKVRWEL